MTKRTPDSDPGQQAPLRPRLRTRERALNHAARNHANVLFLVSGLLRMRIPVDDETAQSVEDSARKLVQIVDELCLARSGATLDRMSTFDRVLHLVGLVSGGIVAVGATGGIALPPWLIAAAGIMAYASGATAAKVTPKGLFGAKPDARGQIADAENPK